MDSARLKGRPFIPGFEIPEQAVCALVSQDLGQPDGAAKTREDAVFRGRVGEAQPPLACGWIGSHRPAFLAMQGQVAATAHGDPGDEGEAAPSGPEQVVHDALATAGKIAPADAGSPSAVSAITDAPIWLILLLVLVVAGVAAGVVMGARRHTK